MRIGDFGFGIADFGFVCNKNRVCLKNDDMHVPMKCV